MDVEVISLTEDEARAAIIQWARSEFYDTENDAYPEVEIVKIAYCEEDENWSATLDVSTSADDPIIEFYMAGPGFGLQIVTIEY